MSEHVYFKAAGASLVAAKDILEKTRTQAQKSRALMKEFGAINIAARGGSISGFVFKGDICPHNWKKVGKIVEGTVFAPYKRSKTDRELWKKINDCTLVTGSEHHSAFFKNGGIIKGHFSIWYATAHKVGEDIIISVPVDSNGNHGKPEDAIQLKNSEYWALKEAAEADKATEVL